MVVLVDAPEGLIAYRPSRTDRVRARFLASRSDQRLALGVAPEHDICLALRAQHLVRAETRRWLADSLHHLLDEARRPPRVPPSPMSFECRRRLVESEELVATIIGELQRPGPISCQGVAQLCVLLRDGTGPLYGRGTTRDLRERFDQVHRQLMPLSVW